MFRRKTRNSTAYTGVGLAAPSAQAPDNSAMAAALTIGQNLKQTRPEVYGKPNATPLMTRYAPPKPTLSLLKRSSSIQSSTGSFSPAQNRTGLNLSNRHSMAPAGNRQVYNIDDSFNDSFFEEVGHEADAHYSNEAQLRDLKLHHQPRTPQVKMVKKYIPTPNGITVIEVPEETMKKEIARSNSMRSGLSVGRAGLLRSHSMTNAAKGKKTNRLRLSSLVNAPRIDEQSELEYQSTQSSRTVSHASAELDALKRQIEHEKQLARDLERQRAEYEQLKQLRLENERKLRELQSLQEEEAESFRDVSSFEEKAPISKAKSEPSKAEPVTPNGVHTPIKTDSEAEEDVPIAPLSFVVDELDLKKHHGPNEDDESALEDTIDLYAEPEKALDTAKKSAPISTPPQNVEVNSHGDTFIPLSESSKDANGEDPNENFGIEEIPNESFESPNLATQLRPTFVSQPENGSKEKPANNITYQFEAFPEDSQTTEAAPSFDPVPEIITQDTGSPRADRARETSEESFMPPPNFAGSIRSFSSVDSKSKPIKSAMKNAKPAYSAKNNSNESPAHQAYLSLTTAENTRLNSKLSAPHLNEPGLVPEAKPQAPRSPNNQQKRISQSLRKQPSAASQNGLAGRSLRPQSMMDNQPGRVQNGGMSNRNLKHTPQPIAPHPTSKPNYQSPSKLKAAELYAKANKRPISEFQSIPRKSSFSRDAAPPQNVQGQVPQRSPHRMTLRAPPQASQVPQVTQASTQPSAAQNGRVQHLFGGSNFRSKFADSDDENDSGIGGSRLNGGFLSRFADSDDESPRILSGKRHTSSSPIKSLRKKEEKYQEEPAPKEKKPKKKFLKKLFGRN